MSSFTIQTILVFCVLLPGLYSFKALNNLTDMYVDRSSTWNTPKVATYILSQAIAIHIVLFFLFSFYYFLFSLNPDFFELVEFKKLLLGFINLTPENFQLSTVIHGSVFVLIYVLTGIKLGNVLGGHYANKAVFSANNNNSVQGSAIINHNWALGMLKPNEQGLNEYTAYVYTKENSENGRLQYFGDISDFFIDQNGKFEYLVLKNASKRYLADSDISNSQKIQWDEIYSFKGPDSERHKEFSFIYIQSSEIFNIFIRPKTDKQSVGTKPKIWISLTSLFLYSSISTFLSIMALKL